MSSDIYIFTPDYFILLCPIYKLANWQYFANLAATSIGFQQLLNSLTASLSTLNL